MTAGASEAFERFIDNLELVLAYRADLKKLGQNLHDQEPSVDPKERFWERYDTLDMLQVMTQASLAQFVSGVIGDVQN